MWGLKYELASLYGDYCWLYHFEEYLELAKEKNMVLSLKTHIVG
jgi:hypothetical protein